MPAMKDVVEAARWCPSCGAGVDPAPGPHNETHGVSAGGDDAHPLREGALIDGRYRLGAVIGRGGFGEVVEALHVGTRQAVAIKVLHSEGADPVTVQRFLREARVTATLRSPHTVRVLDVGLIGTSTLYLAMERLTGRTLEAHLQDAAGQPRAIAEGEAVAIAIAILRSSEEAHRHGLVHRDLKPANVFLCDDSPTDDGTPLVKVLDFGIAHAEGSELTQSATIIGSPTWMSPEQCRSLPLDGRSDLYAVAAILFRCVAGRPPFVDASPLNVMYRHIHEAPAPLAQVAQVAISSGLAAVVARGLAKEPAARFADAAAMREALEALRQRPQLSLPQVSQSIHAARPALVNLPTPAPAKAVGRHATLIAGAIAAATACVWLALELWGPTPPKSAAPPVASAPG